MTKTRSKALARRASTRPIPATRIVRDVAVVAGDKLTDEIAVGTLAPIRLSKQAEKILSEDIDPDQVSIKPTGQVYYSHPAYTRWFNRAFGRLRWAVVPVAKPMLNGKLVCVPYVLQIEGVSVAFAVGEQDYLGDAGNREQSYGDAIEATVASALRRFAKRMGVGLELWDKAWGDRFVRDHAVRVRVKGPRDDKPKYQWRLKTATKLPYELDASTGEVEDGDVEPAQRRETPRGGWDGGDAKLISGPQLNRLFAITRNSGRSEEQVRDWLARVGFASPKDITRRDYDRVCNAILGEDKLPVPLK